MCSTRSGSLVTIGFPLFTLGLVTGTLWAARWRLRPEHRPGLRAAGVAVLRARAAGARRGGLARPARRDRHHARLSVARWPRSAATCCASLQRELSVPSGLWSSIGLSHHSAPLAVRERLAAAPERVGDELRALLRRRAARRGRAALDLQPRRADRDHRASRTARASTCCAASTSKSRPSASTTYLYEHRGHRRRAPPVPRRLGARLDGARRAADPRPGQRRVRDRDRARRSVGALLGRCFERAFGVAKRVRTETEIAAGNVSVSSIACELAEQIFGDLAGAPGAADRRGQDERERGALAHRARRAACPSSTAAPSARPRWRRRAAATPSRSKRSPPSCPPPTW